MSHRRICAALLAALMTLAVTACGPAEEGVSTGDPLGTPPPARTPAAATPAPSATPGPAPTPSPTPLPDEAPEWGEQSFAQEYTAEDGTLLLTAACILPAVSNAERSLAGGIINDWYAGELRTFRSDADSAAEWAAGDYEVSAATGIPFSPGVLTMTSEITYLSDACVSVRRELYVGGEGVAHPSVFRIGEQFSLESGRLLGFADLVKDPERAVELFREAIPRYNATEADGEVLTGLFYPDNFYLTDQGFTFWFQGEGLTAGSPVEVSVPYEEGKDVLVSWIAP